MNVALNPRELAGESMINCSRQPILLPLLEVDVQENLVQLEMLRKATIIQVRQPLGNCEI